MVVLGDWKLENTVNLREIVTLDWCIVGRWGRGDCQDRFSLQVSNSYKEDRLLRIKSVEKEILEEKIIFTWYYLRKMATQSPD